MDRLILAGVMAALLLVAHLTGPALASDKQPAVSNASFTGDLPVLKQRRVIRALVVHGPTDFFFQKGKPSGIQVELLKRYEAHLNKGIKSESRKIHVVYVPTPFAQLLPDLVAGKGDIAADFLTDTAERRKNATLVSARKVAVSELIVANKKATGVNGVDDLSGKSVFVLPGSSYLEHLRALNKDFRKRGMKPVDVQTVDSNLNEEGLLELVNAGTFGLTVVDDFKAKLWEEILPNIRVLDKVALSRDNHLGWAVRKTNKALAEDLQAFWASVSKGTLAGNILLRRYYADTRWIKNPVREQARQQFFRLMKYFTKYGKQYGFDPLALAAQGFQESGLDQSRKSHRGAVGVMQLLPATAADRVVNIPDIGSVDNNIHAGAKYMAFLRDHYFSDPGIHRADRLAFALAAYNAGPAKVRKMRDLAKKMGLNPNVWFGNVETAADKITGRETVRYVANIYKFYAAYKRLAEQNPEEFVSAS